LAAGAWTPVTQLPKLIADGTFDFDTDSFKVALFLSTSNIGAGSTTFAGVTNEHAGANGYTAGGVAVTLTASAANPCVIDISSDPVWTASGGSIVARFAVLYEVGGSVVAHCLLDATPADVTTTTGNTLTLVTHASGVATIGF